MEGRKKGKGGKGEPCSRGRAGGIGVGQSSGSGRFTTDRLITNLCGGRIGRYLCHCNFCNCRLRRAPN